jgi:hypothetical protein
VSHTAVNSEIVIELQILETYPPPKAACVGRRLSVGAVPSLCCKTGSSYLPSQFTLVELAELRCLAIALWNDDAWRNAMAVLIHLKVGRRRTDWQISSELPNSTPTHIADSCALSIRVSR